jgi:lipopolysaccharide biosynthesis regulator YciM
MRRNPTLLGLDRLLEAEMIGASEVQRRDMEMVKGLVHQHTKRLGLYRCDNCGFRARQYYWRCPAVAGGRATRRASTRRRTTNDTHRINAHAF